MNHQIRFVFGPKGLMSILFLNHFPGSCLFPLFEVLLGLFVVIKDFYFAIMPLLKSW